VGEYQIVQSTPSDSHAASTSGPASWRKMFAWKSEPLKSTVENVISTSSNSGACFLSVRLLKIASQMEGIQYFDIFEIQF
jgi:hypothetical protein